VRARAVLLLALMAVRCAKPAAAEVDTCPTLHGRDALATCVWGEPSKRSCFVLNRRVIACGAGAEAPLASSCPPSMYVPAATSVSFVDAGCFVVELPPREGGYTFLAHETEAGYESTVPASGRLRCMIAGDRVVLCVPRANRGAW